MNSEEKTGCRIPPERPLLAAVDSPVSSTVDGEKVWSPNEPLVVALEIRNDCAPKDGGAPGNPALTTTAWS